MATGMALNNNHAMTENEQESHSNHVGSGNTACKDHFALGKEDGTYGTRSGGRPFHLAALTRNKDNATATRGTTKVLPTGLSRHLPAPRLVRP